MGRSGFMEKQGHVVDWCGRKQGHNNKVYHSVLENTSSENLGYQQLSCYREGGQEEEADMSAAEQGVSELGSCPFFPSTLMRFDRPPFSLLIWRTCWDFLPLAHPLWHFAVLPPKKLMPLPHGL